MKIVLVACVAALVAACEAGAADLPVKAPPLAPVDFGWTGFYLGANVGYGWGRVGGDLVGNSTGLDIPLAIAGGTIPSSYGLRDQGVIGGGQIGYNWQLRNWVWGLETDFQGAGLTGSVAFAHAASVVPALKATQSAGSASLDWFGTARARAGYS